MSEALQNLRCVFLRQSPGVRGRKRKHGYFEVGCPVLNPVIIASIQLHHQHTRRVMEERISKRYTHIVVTKVVEQSVHT